MRRILPLLFCIVLLGSSCTMQRRIYNRGYYIDRAHHVVSTSTPTRTTETLPDSVTPGVPAIVIQVPADTSSDTASHTSSIRQTVKAFVHDPAKEIIAHVGPASKVSKLAHAQPKKHHKYGNSAARETVRDALILGLVADFVIGPLSALVLLQPDLLFTSHGSNEGIFFILSCPLISVVLTFFALRSIPKVIGAISHRQKGDTGTVVLGILAILLCLVACVIGIGTTIYLVAHPVLALVLVICALIGLLILLIEA